MVTRIPLIVAVVGALLVGGATTGTTRASWTDGANLQPAAVGSGSMGNTASASPTSLTVQRGSSATSRVTVTDTSSAAAKNLQQRITPTLTGSLPSGVTATLTTVGGGGACTGTSQGPVVLVPGGSFSSCVTVTASSSSTASSATVTVSIDGVQVRGGTASGWSSPTRTLNIPVTIQSSVLPPAITCAPGQGVGGAFAFSWLSVPGATSYQVEASGDGTSFGVSASLGIGPSSYTHLVLLEKNEVLYVRVVATGAGGAVAVSNTLLLERRGNSSNVDCEDQG